MILFRKLGLDSIGIARLNEVRSMCESHKSKKITLLSAPLRRISSIRRFAVYAFSFAKVEAVQQTVLGDRFLDADWLKPSAADSFLVSLFYCPFSRIFIQSKIRIYLQKNRTRMFLTPLETRNFALPDDLSHIF